MKEIRLKQMVDQSFYFYEKFLQGGIREYLTQWDRQLHWYLLNTSEDSKFEHFYKTLYAQQWMSEKPDLTTPNDSNCAKCKKFHVPGTEFNKDKDIGFGRQIEKYIQNFLNDTFLEMNSIFTEKKDYRLADKYDGLKCESATDIDMHNPDLRIVDRNGDIKHYLEIKVIFRPYVYIKSANKGKEWECFSHSLTLDYDSKDQSRQKFEKQRNRIEAMSATEKTAFVYLYDIPCIRGIFWMPAQKVFEHVDNQKSNPVPRKTQSDDFRSDGKPRTATTKIYLPLFEMNDLNSLIKWCAI